jgi:hypothetical protein
MPHLHNPFFFIPLTLKFLKTNPMRRTEFTKWQPSDRYALMGTASRMPQSSTLLLRVMAVLMLVLSWTWRTDAQCTIVCNDDAQLSLPGPTANCEALVVAFMVLKSPPSSCPGPKMVTIFDAFGNQLPQQPYAGGNIGTLVDEKYIGQRLTVRVADIGSGNYCWGHLTIEDKLGPEFSNCRDTTIWCLQDPRPVNKGGQLPLPIVRDCTDSSSIVLVNVDSLTIGLCTDTFSQRIRRTWIATDLMGNSNSCQQTIILKRVSLGDTLVKPQCPDNVSIECNNITQISTDPRSTGYPYIVLDSVKYNIVPGASFACELASSYKDEVFQLCGGGRKILRTWTIYDWCLPTAPGLNPFTCIQVIKVEDKQPPTIKCPPAITVSTNSWSCAANVTLPAAVVVDSCSSFTVSVLTPVGVLPTNGGLIRNVPAGSHILTYVATDACGNTSTCSTRLVVQDQTPPVAVCDEYTVVSLTNDGTAIAYASTFDDGSNDNCAIDRFMARRMPDECQDSTGFWEFITFDCCDLGDTVNVVFRVFDKAGNYNDCMVQVFVQDKLPPVVTCPGPKTIDCSERQIDFNRLGTATATDNCDSVEIVETIERYVDQCGVGYIDRIFTATDRGGRQGTCSQRITVVNSDPFDVNDIEWPIDWTIYQCNPSTDPNEIPCTPVNYCKPKLRANACGLIAVTYTDQLLPISYPACYKILRKWIVIDWCQYNPNSPISNGYWSHTQVIKVLDDTPPVLNCPADTIYASNLTANCGPVLVTLPPVTATDCASSLTSIVSVDINNNGSIDTTFVGYNASGLFPSGKHSVIITVEDGCGNNATCRIIVVVTDGKKPTPVCLNGVSATLMPDGQGGGMVELTPAMFDNSSFDNCTPRNKLKFRLDPHLFTCDNLGLNLVRLTVIDEAGNADFCETFVDIQDNMGVCSGMPRPFKIAGAITDESGDGVQNVKVDLNNNNNLINSLTTDATGGFTFNGLQQGYDYTVAPRTTDNASNGVSTFDLVLVSKHVLNVSYLDSPYKIIAADANKSGTITTLDLVAIRKVVLRIAQEFPNNSSWRFIDRNYRFANPMNPFQTPIPEAINVNNISADQLQANFIAVKVGDVNGSAVPNNLLGVDVRSERDYLTLSTSDREFTAGELIEMPISAEDFSGIVGYQFTIDFDKQSLELTDVKSGVLDNLNEGNFGLTMVDDGIITTSWDNSKTTLSGKTGALFTLVFRAKTNGSLSQHIKFNSRYTEAEAYANTDGVNIEVRNVRLNFANGREVVAGFELYQNNPNPFTGSTTIGFNLPEAGPATVTIFDLSGKVVKSFAGNYAKGYNEINLTSAELNNQGVLYYRLETSNHTATRKMILVK